jgi:hypothetical protein
VAWTTPATATAGSTALTASFWNTNVRDNTIALPRGYVAATTLATTFVTASASYVDVTGLSVTFTAEANRRYLVSLQYVLGAGSAPAQIMINNTSADIVEGYASLANFVTTSVISIITTPSAGSTTYKARVQSSGGNATVYGTSTRSTLISRLTVMDIGSTV